MAQDDLIICLDRTRGSLVIGKDACWGMQETFYMLRLKLIKDSREMCGSGICAPKSPSSSELDLPHIQRASADDQVPEDLAALCSCVCLACSEV